MTRSFDYTKKSPLHKRQAQNRLIKKISRLFLVVGGLALVIALTWLALVPTRELADRAMHTRIAICYGGSAVIALLLYWLLERLRDKFMHGLDQGRVERRRRHRRRRGKRRRSSEESGAVLILVLVLLGLLSGLLLQAQVTARTRLERHRAGLDEVRLRTAAMDAVRAAMQELADDPDLTVDHLEEPWAAPKETTDPTGVNTYVEVIDENRFFDLNNLRKPHAPESPLRDPRDIYMDILNHCGVFAAVGKAENLVNWIDEDDAGLNERTTYLALEPPYETPDRWLFSWSEMLYIKEYDRALFDRHVRSSALDAFQGNLLDTVTVLPVVRVSPIPLNLNTAGAEAIKGVLGIGREPLAESIVAMRDLRPVRSLESLSGFVQEEWVETVRPYLDVKSSFFRIDASASLQGHTEQVRAVAQRDGSGRVKLLQWIY